MEKRIFIAIVLSIAFLWGWAAIAPKFFPELARKPVRPATSSAAATATTASSAASTPPAAASTASQAPAVTAAPKHVEPVSAGAVQYTVVETENFTARFSNKGAQLVSFRLKSYFDKSQQEVELVKAREAARTDFPFALESQNAAVADRLNAALYAVDDRDEKGVHVIEFRYADADGVSATKAFRFGGSEYLFQFAISVTPAVPYRVVIGPGLRTLSPEEHDSRVIMTGNGVVQRDGKLKIENREKGDQLRVYQNADFIGIEDNYFLSVLRPTKGGDAILRRIDIPAGAPSKQGRKELYAGLNATASGTVAGEAFFGPKETKLLDKYGLASTLQFGIFGLIARFLLDALVWINKTTHNYGFAIIVLTILIKVALYPLQHKSIVSMKKMQKVQPKMEAIKSKYKKAKTDPDQRQKMNVEMMSLYKQEGVNPMSGCLPIVLQLPILWGFYGLLSRAIELRGAPFIFWIHDLSDKDPYYITPLLMTITMFVQTWVTPSTGDPTQRKMFLAMPVVFGWIFKEFPSGLVLYWLVQNILTIAQQMIMNKWWKEHPADLNKS